MDIKTLFISLNHPSNTSYYSAIAIPGFDDHKIAKDYFGRPSLLISSPKGYSKFPIQSKLVNLKNIDIKENSQCNIQSENSAESESFFTVISLVGDIELQDYFLDICNSLIAKIPNAPSSDDIHKIISTFVELLLSEPLKKIEIQGLLGELIVISEGYNPSQLASSWHSNPKEKYDFSSKNKKIEVKSASNRERIHHFRYSQLQDIENNEILVASIFIEQSTGGSNIKDILEDIKNKVNDVNLYNSLLNICKLSLLDNDFVNTYKHYRINYELAKESLSFFSSHDVPSVENQHSKLVTNIEFQSNLSLSKSLDENALENFFMDF